ncbi:hypothetical protein ABEB36_000534 [Hypothenemus hampei]|uniref:Uncharacterized protein n=1 Tax=Hypothenemus hampei TaxID=57062 RepID=A0ABD1FCD1_HYPHA
MLKQDFHPNQENETKQENKKILECPSTSNNARSALKELDNCTTSPKPLLNCPDEDNHEIAFVNVSTNKSFQYADENRDPLGSLNVSGESALINDNENSGAYWSIIETSTNIEESANCSNNWKSFNNNSLLEKNVSVKESQQDQTSIGSFDSEIIFQHNNKGIVKASNISLLNETEDFSLRLESSTVEESSLINVFSQQIECQKRVSTNAMNNSTILKDVHEILPVQENRINFEEHIQGSTQNRFSRDSIFEQKHNITVAYQNIPTQSYEENNKSKELALQSPLDVHYLSNTNYGSNSNMIRSPGPSAISIRSHIQEEIQSERSIVQKSQTDIKEFETVLNTVYESAKQQELKRINVQVIDEIQDQNYYFSDYKVDSPPVVTLNSSKQVEENESIPIEHQIEIGMPIKEHCSITEVTLSPRILPPVNTTFELDNPQIAMESAESTLQGEQCNFYPIPRSNVKSAELSTSVTLEQKEVKELVLEVSELDKKASESTKRETSLFGFHKKHEEEVHLFDKEVDAHISLTTSPTIKNGSSVSKENVDEAEYHSLASHISRSKQSTQEINESTFSSNMIEDAFLKQMDVLDFEEILNKLHSLTIESTLRSVNQEKEQQCSGSMKMDTIGRFKATSANTSFESSPPKTAIIHAEPENIDKVIQGIKETPLTVNREEEEQSIRLEKADTIDSFEGKPMNTTFESSPPKTAIIHAKPENIDKVIQGIKETPLTVNREEEEQSIRLEKADTIDSFEGKPMNTTFESSQLETVIVHAETNNTDGVIQETKETTLLVNQKEIEEQQSIRLEKADTIDSFEGKPMNTTFESSQLETVIVHAETNNTDGVIQEIKGTTLLVNQEEEEEQQQSIRLEKADTIDSFEGKPMNITFESSQLERVIVHTEAHNREEVIQETKGRTLLVNQEEEEEEELSIRLEKADTTDSFEGKPMNITFESSQPERAIVHAQAHNTGEVIQETKDTILLVNQEEHDTELEKASTMDSFKVKPMNTTFEFSQKESAVVYVETSNIDEVVQETKESIMTVNQEEKGQNVKLEKRNTLESFKCKLPNTTFESSEPEEEIVPAEADNINEVTQKPKQTTLIIDQEEEQQNTRLEKANIIGHFEAKSMNTTLESSQSERGIVYDETGNIDEVIKKTQESILIANQEEQQSSTLTNANIIGHIEVSPANKTFETLQQERVIVHTEAGNTDKFNQKTQESTLVAKQEEQQSSRLDNADTRESFKAPSLNTTFETLREEEISHVQTVNTVKIDEEPRKNIKIVLVNECLETTSLNSTLEKVTNQKEEHHKLDSKIKCRPSIRLNRSDTQTILNPIHLKSNSSSNEDKFEDIQENVGVCNDESIISRGQIVEGNSSREMFVRSTNQFIVNSSKSVHKVPSNREKYSDFEDPQQNHDVDNEGCDVNTERMHSAEISEATILNSNTLKQKVQFIEEKVPEYEADSGGLNKKQDTNKAIELSVEDNSKSKHQLLIQKRDEVKHEFYRLKAQLVQKENAYVLIEQKNDEQELKYNAVRSKYQEQINNQNKDLIKLNMRLHELDRQITMVQLAKLDISAKYEKALMALEVCKKNDENMKQNIVHGEKHLQNIQSKCMKLRKKLDEIKTAKEQENENKKAAFKQKVAELQTTIQKLRVRKSFLEKTLKLKEEEELALAALSKNN